MRTKLLSLIAFAAMLAAGCTTPAETVQQTNDALDNTANAIDSAGNAANNATSNATVAAKPPVARMQVYQGALVFESNFVADNTTAGATVKGGEAVNFLGSASEAVDKTATIAKWEWSFGDGQSASGRSVSHTFGDTGGIVRVALKVTDSHGLWDDLVLTLGVTPTKTFNVTIDLGGALAGPSVLGAAPGGGETAAHPFPIEATMQGLPVVVDTIKLTITPSEPTSEFDLRVLDPAGNVTATTASGSFIGPEPALPNPGVAKSLELQGLEPGAYVLDVLLYFGAQGNYKITGEVLYKVVNPQVAALGSGGH